MSTTPPSSGSPTVLLADWGQAVDRALRGGDALRALIMAEIVLRQRPRHLPTYQRLIDANWRLQRWQKAGEWGRRLLQADPGNAPAWRAVARELEDVEERQQAHAAWLRAFECAPYDPLIRAGVNRTILGRLYPLSLNHAALAQLHLRGYRWRQAAVLYRELLDANPRRSDYLIGLTAALWRQGRRGDAYRAARYATQHYPHAVLPWAVLADLGDATDRALAQNPLTTMDPDGEFIYAWLRLESAPPQERRDVPKRAAQAARVSLSPAEAMLNR